MAWVLRKKDSDEKLRLLANKEYIVGRKEVDIILNNDQSISRKHAVLAISHPETNISNPSNIPIVKLIDTSKYGTSVNGEKIDKNGTILKSGDAILFGILGNDWSIEYKPFVCTTSFLQKPERALVRQYLTKIGGHIVPEWTSQCNLLIMTQLNMSIKVVNSLASLCHIVTSKFLKDFLDSLEKRSEEPNHKRYIPPLAEPLCRETEDSFMPNRLRSSVFVGFKFFCISSKQLKKLQFSIEIGGGEAILFESCKKSIPNLLKDEGVCILQPSTEELKEVFVKTLTNHLEKYSLRYISEAEIGMAILHCSTERFCNPRGSGEKEYLLQPLQSQSMSLQFMNTLSVNSEQMELSVQVKMESCETAEGSSDSDQRTSRESDPFLKDTLEYSADCEPQKWNKNTNFIKKINSPEERLANPHPGPSRLSPDMFGDISPGPCTTKEITSKGDSHLIGAQKKSSTLNEKRGVRKDADDVKQDSESGNLNLSIHHSRQTSQSVTNGGPSPESQPAAVRKRCKAIEHKSPAGFLSARNLPSVKTEDDSSNDLETSRIIIKFEPMIRKRRLEENVLPVSNGHTKKNFKKFKKVLPKCMSATGRTVPFRPSNGLTATVREPNPSEDDVEPMNSSPSYSQSQSAGLFDWPENIRK